jgi:peptide/nickel transport system permease protein
MKKLPTVWIAAWFTIAACVAWSATGEHRLERTLQPALLAHPFGFDAFGRDVLETVLRASLRSALFALGAVGVSLALSIALGTAMALAPPFPRFLARRALDFLLAFPSLLFALGYAAIRGPGWDTLAAALLFGTLPFLTRLVYARSQEILAQEYVLAARSLGATSQRIMLRHLGPPVLSVCLVSVPNLFAQALMAEATLSFMGIGAPIGHDTWGSLLAQSKDYLIEAPHLAMGTGLPLVATVLSLQILSSQLLRKA